MASVEAETPKAWSLKCQRLRFDRIMAHPVDLEISFEILNAILQLDCRFCVWQVSWSVDKQSLRQF